MRKLCFPERYRPEGTKTASEDELEASSSACECAAVWFGFLVVVSVIAELVIAGIHPAYDAPLQRWGSPIADLFMMVGIVGEILSSMRNNRIQTELRERSNARVEAATDAAAKAHERAAQLEKEAAEIKRIVAWRQLTREQHEQIIPFLRDLSPSIDLLVEYERGNAEAWSYGRDIMTVFQEAGVRKVRECSSSMSGLTWGVFVGVSPDIDGDPIEKAFAAAGVAIAFFKMDLSPFLLGIQQKPNVYVFVGPKPPPM